MNSRERILAALRRDDVDPVPCCVSFNPLNPVQRRGHRWNFPWPPEASGEQRLAYQVEQLGLDQVVDVWVGLCRPAPGVESRTWLEGDVLHKTFTTPAGELHASVRHNDLWPHGNDIPFFSDFNIGHFVEPWVRTEAVRQVLDVFGPRGLILSPCVSAHSIMPWESTLAMIDEWKRLR